MRSAGLLLLFIFVALSQVHGQSGSSRITGMVFDEQGDPLENVSVLVRELSTGRSTGSSGRYDIPVRPGTYTLQFSMLGYERLVDTVQVTAGQNVYREYRMVPTYFEIGAITVTAPDDLMSRDLETGSVISSGEIQHMATASLGTVLQLMPGVQTTNPTLNTPEQGVIRGGDALGTQILVDGVPITNNANMQIGIGANTANRGLDLRQFTAENIEEVSVIRGIPSVEYGDMTDGAIIVRTRSRPEPLRLKISYNPNITEYNASGGFRLGSSGWVLNSNANIASARNDIRIEDDGYTRFSGQINLRRRTDDWNFSQSLYATRALDERQEQPGYALRQAWYNRDVNLRYSGEMHYDLNSSHRTRASWSVNHTRQNSYEQRLISRDNMVVSNAEKEGTREGTIVFGSYLGRQWIRGSVWNVYADVNHRWQFETGALYHQLLGGITFRSDFNRGDGIEFDPLYPPSLTNPSPRLRTYDDLPAFNILSLYIQDHISGRIGIPFRLQAGVRYEAYRPTGINPSALIGDGALIESRNGTFLNPRVNLSLHLAADTRLRLGYGVTSKSPPMGMVFAQDRYYDIVDTVSVVDPSRPEANFALVTTHIRQQANPNLQGYKQQKFEISLDQQIGKVGLSATAFLNRSDDMFRIFSEPTAFYQHSFPNWPDESGAMVRDTLLESYPTYINDGWHHAHGLELSLRTQRFTRINTAFRVDAAYIDNRRGNENGIQYGSRRFSDEFGRFVLPVYATEERYDRNLLFNYRAEIQSRSLGLWVTIHVQQQLFNIDGRDGLSDTLAIGYYTPSQETVFIPEEERGDERYIELRRRYEDFQLLDEERPNLWLMNLNVSKSLFEGSEVTFFVNNIFNHRPRYQLRRRAEAALSYERRNPPVFYGVEFSYRF
ncbi:TonB-dependent receptor [Balneolales bacterium ANBcel1]|nr:TonB-dependent receptor [Balneolales bacterium ANBcel1]